MAAQSNPQLDAQFQQYVLLDTLLDNWDGVRVRMGPVSVELEAELARVAALLAAARQPGQVAQALDLLLDATEDTAAYDYVRALIRRSALPEATTTRGAIGAQASAAYPQALLLQASAGLAAAAGATALFQSVPIFYVTNRQGIDGRPLEDRFTGEYAPDLSYGSAAVTIPLRTHRVGRIERPMPLVGFESQDRHVVLARDERLNAASFAVAIAQALSAAKRPELLVFLHGYRVSFEEAARRAAQVAADIGFGGVVLLFSWPSAGTLLGYTADENNAAKSVEPLRALLRDLEGGPWDRVHLMAHSMGNRVMVGSLADREPGWRLPIRQVVLVAADLDADLFRQQYPALRARVLPGPDGLITSYSSRTDRALGISSWLHGASRTGRVGDQPITLDGLEAVDATDTDTSLVGTHHGYFAEQRSLLTDLGLLLREGLPAAQRGLARVQEKWWAFPR